MFAAVTVAAALFSIYFFLFVLFSLSRKTEAATKSSNDDPKDQKHAAN